MLEALLKHERATGGSPEATGARLRGQEYLLERRLFRRRSTGEVIERDRKGGAESFCQDASYLEGGYFELLLPNSIN
ncbi:MAG TPA: hypothetical protein VMS73_08305 [Anaerolineaceae bacterium]|nr:hypothetical protein [Anaerolineaceae bacterium]